MFQSASFRKHGFGVYLRTCCFLLVCVGAGAFGGGPIRAQEPGGLVQWAWPEADVREAGDGFWPQFRGPEGQGHAATGSRPPVEWSEDRNVRWKVPIDGKGWSSPVVWGDRVWVTTAASDGTSDSVYCISRTSGEILVHRKLWDNPQVQKDHHVTNSYASPTPVMDAKRVYVHFGAYGTAALDAVTGETIWERRDLPCNHFRGPGSSPILFEDLLIFHMDGFDFKYVVALDKATGKTVWKVDRQVDYGTDDGDVHKAYSTPTIFSSEGRLELISPTSKATIAYDPRTGEKLWWVRYDEFSTTARPVHDGKLIYLNTGFSKAQLLAVRPGGSGDVTDSHVIWRANRAISNKPSHVLSGEYVFSVEDRGVLACFSKADGQMVWQDRIGGDFSASPILAGGHLYLFDHEGAGYVYEAGGEPRRISKNQLATGCRASPVAVANQLIVRTLDHLYCLEASEAVQAAP